MQTAIHDFLADPMIAPIYGLLVLAMFDWILGVYAAWSEGTFTWAESSRVLKSTVLDRVVPLAFLGAAAFLAPDEPVIAGVSIQATLTALYVPACALAVVSLLAGFRDKWGSAKNARALTKYAAKAADVPTAKVADATVTRPKVK